MTSIRVREDDLIGRARKTGLIGRARADVVNYAALAMFAGIVTVAGISAAIIKSSVGLPRGDMGGAIVVAEVALAVAVVAVAAATARSFAAVKVVEVEVRGIRRLVEVGVGRAAVEVGVRRTAVDEAVFTTLATAAVIGEGLLLGTLATGAVAAIEAVYRTYKAR
ncbi:MAG: hypothetical protein KGR16_07895 [Verrucomicrobia bacterium]|nr:hypothetical protein [Verrucomicrobiota bacterium]MDE3046794.1 hypothetical protein [Verrucomicrobiota bacterium]